MSNNDIKMKTATKKKILIIEDPPNNSLNEEKEEIGAKEGASLKEEFNRVD